MPELIIIWPADLVMRESNELADLIRAAAGGAK